jgi:transcriptional regulator with XRE-family HTH domain
MTLYYVRPTLPATIQGGSSVPLTDDEFRARFRDVLARSGLSMRALSAALGRDPGYVAALLDPSRPSRARPTPADLLRASDATGIPFVELLEALWGIERLRLADELGRLGLGGSADTRLAGLSDAERAEVSDFVAFLVARHRRDARPQSRLRASRCRS